MPTFDENCERLKREAEERRLLREFQMEMRTRKLFSRCLMVFGAITLVLYFLAAVRWW